MEKRERWTCSGLLNRTSLISFSRFHAWHGLIKRALLRSYVIGDMEKLWRAVFPQLDSCWASTSRPAVTPQDPGSVINYMCQSYVWLPPVCQSRIWYKQPTSLKRLTRFKNTRQDFCPQYVYKRYYVLSKTRMYSKKSITLPAITSVFLFLWSSCLPSCLLPIFCFLPLICRPWLTCTHLHQLPL